MRSRSDYYETRLYPLQDGVLRCVEGCKTDFFLTGGTALGRGYYGHRYSDDLDFFLCSDDRFNEQVESVLAGLRLASFRRDESRDFVNDAAPRYGEIVATPVFARTDSVRNILDNKLTALFHFESKDVADLHAICRYRG